MILGCGGTSIVHPSHNRNAASGVGVSTPCAAVSTRSIFVPGLMESRMYGRIYDTGM